MKKLEQFKARAAAHGQTVTLYPFSAHPGGAYVDPPSGYPDPESGSYPGTVPATSYGPAVSVRAFVQPFRWKDTGGQAYVKNQHGEDVAIDLVAYLPGDQAVTVRDKVVYSGVNYEVLRIRPWVDSAVVVYRTVELQKMTE